MSPVSRRHRVLRSLSSIATTSLLISAAWSTGAPAAEPLVLRQIVEVHPGDVSVRRYKEGTDFILLRGGGPWAAEGTTDLPALPVTLRLPEGMAIESVSARVVESQTLRGTFRLTPVRTVSSDGKLNPVSASVEVSDADGFVPASLAQVGYSGRMRGRPLGGVVLTPFRYRRSDGRLDLLTRVELEIHLIPVTRDKSQDFVPMRREPWADAQFGGLIDALAINTSPADAGRTARAAAELKPLINSGGSFEPTFRPSVNGSPVEMVILTNETLQPIFQQLADWKTRSGIPTVVRTVSWVKANYPKGADTPETLRNFIRDAAQKWGTIYVLLGGDSDVIPPRYGKTQFFGGEEIPTDLYYQCVDGNWNANGNYDFGEGFGSVSQPGDDADLYPEVWIGRIPVSDTADAQTVITKILNYEQPASSIGYVKSFLALGEVLFPQQYQPGDSILFDGGDVCEEAIVHLPGNWEVARLYEHCPSSKWPSCILEYKPTVIDSINAGFGIVHHVGHGYINTMAVGKDDLALSNADADAFSNDGQAFFLYAINCTSSAFDFSCIAERFLMNSHGGSVASIGSTRFDFPSTGWGYQNEFYRLVFDVGVKELGQAAARCKLPFIPLASQDNTHRWTQFTQIFFGDPSMKLWTDTPLPLSVSYPGGVALGTQTFTVNVLRSGSPVDSARVCLNKAGDEYAVGYTNLAGAVTLPFPPDSTGTFQVTVVADNSLPYKGTATVTAPVTPYLYAQSQMINDATGLAVGNGDGKIDAGETIELKLPLKNRGGSTSGAVTATASSGSAFVTVSDSTSSYAAIAGGATVIPGDPIVLSVSRTAPDRTEAKLHLTYTSGATTLHEDIILYVHAPIFEWYSMAVRDTVGNGNGNGIIAPNEDVALRCVLRNGGLGQARGVVAKLRSTDSRFAISDSVITFGNIAGGIRALASPGSSDIFRFQMTDTTGLSASLHKMKVSFYDTYSPTSPLATITIDPRGPAQAVTNLVATGSTASISLTFTRAPETDIGGYNVYRSSTSGGPYTRINQYTTVLHAYFNDEGLPPLTSFFYKVAPQDSSGIEGPLSVAVSTSTTLPLHADFPIELKAATNGSVTLADVDYDGKIDILAGASEIYAVHADGTEVYDGDGDIRTLGPLTSTGSPGYWNAPTVGDVEPDGVPDVAAVSWTGALYLWDNKGNVKPGFPVNVNVFGTFDLNPLGSVAMGDVDNDGKLELFCMAGKVLYGFRSNGTEIVDGDANPSTIGVLKVTSTLYSYGTPALADINGDGKLDVIAGMRDGKLHVINPLTAQELPGFPVVTSGDITSSAAVGDIDNDGFPDIVFGCSESTSTQMRAVKHDGTPVAGWPQGIQLNEDFDSSPALGDLNGDGIPDVVCGASNGRVFAWRNNGVLLPGWPVFIRDSVGANVAVRSSPVLVDIDNDGKPEVIVGDQKGRLHAFYANGQPVPGFPIQTGNLIEGGPAAWDLDGDGLTEIVAESFDQRIYMWDTPWTFNKLASPWPMFHHDPRHTGHLTDPLFYQTAVPETPVPGTRPFVLMQNSPNPFNPVTTIRYRIDSSAGNSGLLPARLDVVSTDGRLIKVLVDRPMPPGNFEVQWDGTDQNGGRVASGVYFYRLATSAGTESRKMTMIR